MPDAAEAAAPSAPETTGAPLPAGEGPLPPWVRPAHEHLLRADPPLAALVRRQGPVARPLTRDYLGRLVRAIVGQQISGKAAAAIYRRLIDLAERTGGPDLPGTLAIPGTPSAPGRPGQPLMPEALAALADDALRACGLSLNKLLAIRDLTQRALDGRLDLRHLDSLPDDEVRAQLVAVRGIGRWTADMFLMFALGRPDVLPAEDLGIQVAVARLYGLDAHPTPAAIRRLAADGGWHPFATAACFHLWESLK